MYPHVYFMWPISTCVSKNGRCSTVASVLPSYRIFKLPNCLRKSFPNSMSVLIRGITTASPLTFTLFSQTSMFIPSLGARTCPFARITLNPFQGRMNSGRRSAKVLETAVTAAPVSIKALARRPLHMTVYITNSRPVVFNAFNGGLFCGRGWRQNLAMWPVL